MMTAIELFKIDSPPHGVFRYTSAQQDLTYDGETWAAVAISREEVEISADIAAAKSIQIRMPIATPFAQLFTRHPPRQPTECTIYRGTVEPGGVAVTEVEALATGVLISSGCEGRVASFELSGRLQTLARTGPRGLYSAVCRHALYSRGCGVDVGDFLETAYVETLTPATKRVDILLPLASAHDPQYFRGGFLRVGSDGDPVLIVDQPIRVGPTASGSSRYELTLAHWSEALLGEPEEVQVAPGCEFTAAICASRFDNLPNFGGFPTLTSTLRSPFFFGWER
jgi:hypothetical protein